MPFIVKKLLIFYQGYSFELIKAVSDTVLDTINAIYHDKPLVLIGAKFREKLVSHHQAVNEVDSCLIYILCGKK